MRILNQCKNVALTLTTTLLYAIWSKNELHEVSPIYMWAILISVAIIFFGLLNSIDKEVRRIARERMRKSLNAVIKRKMMEVKRDD